MSHHFSENLDESSFLMCFFVYLIFYNFRCMFMQLQNLMLLLVGFFSCLYYRDNLLHPVIFLVNKAFLEINKWENLVHANYFDIYGIKVSIWNYNFNVLCMCWCVKFIYVLVYEVYVYVSVCFCWGNFLGCNNPIVHSRSAFLLKLPYKVFSVFVLEWMHLMHLVGLPPFAKFEKNWHFIDLYSRILISIAIEYFEKSPNQNTECPY
jgi:hypothetical protein